MEIFQLAIEPETKGKASTTNGYSYKYILAGSCEFQINDEVFMLEEGDSIYLDGSQPHIFSNKTTNKLHLLSMHFILTDK